MDSSSNSSRGRWILYAVTAAVVAVLAYVGFWYEAPADAGTLIGSARVQLRLGLHDEARSTVEEAIEHYPDDFEVRLVAAEAFARAEDYVRAREELAHPSLSSAGRGQRELILGFVEEKQENFAEAIAAYQQALETIEDEDLQEQVYLGIASIQFRQKDFRTALAECRKVSARWPDRARAYGLMAECHRKLESPQEALVACKRALELAPNDAGTTFLLGEVQIAMGNREAALDAFRRTNELSPRSWEAQLLRAGVALELEQAVEAQDALSAAFEIDPEAVEREMTARSTDGDPTIERLKGLWEGMERNGDFGAPRK